MAPVRLGWASLLNMKNTALSELGQRTAEPPIAWLMKAVLDHPRLISLAAGFTDPQTLPVRETRRLLAEILGARAGGRAALQYGSTAGDEELRQLTARRLRQADESAGANTDIYDAERMLLTHGSQQFLYLLTEALCDPGDIVLVEDPTYFVYLGIAQSHGLRCRGIRLTPDGLEVGHLEQVLETLRRSGELRRLKMLYLVSYFQNPTGITTSLARKRAALELLRHYERHAGHPIYLLEDAAYRDLRFAGEAVPSALATGRLARRVIYAGTYSKPFATGVRVGYGLLPPELFTPAARLKGNHDFGTSHLLQKLLARALDSGAYAAHQQVLQARYAAKAGFLAAALRRHFPPGVEWQKPGGGLYIWARLPRCRRTGPRSKVFRQALAREVLYVPGIFCYAEDPARPRPDHEMRLSFGHASQAAMREGIKRLGAVLARLC